MKMSPRCVQYNSELYFSPKCSSPDVLVLGKKEKELDHQDVSCSLQTPSILPSTLLSMPLSKIVLRARKVSEQHKKKESCISMIRIPEDPDFMIPTLDDCNDTSSLGDDTSISSDDENEELCKISSSFRPRPIYPFLQPKPRKFLSKGTLQNKRRYFDYEEDSSTKSLCCCEGCASENVSISGTIQTENSRAGSSISPVPYCSLTPIKSRHNDKRRYKRTNMN